MRYVVNDQDTPVERKVKDDGFVVRKVEKQDTVSPFAQPPEKKTAFLVIGTNRTTNASWMVGTFTSTFEAISHTKARASLNAKFEVYEVQYSTPIFSTQNS